MNHYLSKIKFLVEEMQEFGVSKTSLNLVQSYLDLIRLDMKYKKTGDENENL